ncbi:hypothetical protein HYDPIDRAFT_117374 [Hydnomerulius pinastri MD-312]|uniref:F-box domain-containing protein n=1 Tax=Hydnomerulius pinastri MD-312 TaxID=994086 RepID=A0A0C9WAQ2_9AGAM|nr:hypothetical protein HYDPIDRAFT_117374 [Hydnomerulius pinastri MD-312]
MDFLVPYDRPDALKDALDLKQDMDNLHAERQRTIAHLKELDIRISQKRKDMRTFRNQFLNISCLPEELLLLIFDIVQRDTIIPDPLSYRIEPVEQALALVCRRWRFYITNASMFWTRIFVTPQTTIKNLEAYIERSRHQLVTVEFHRWFYTPGETTWAHSLERRLALVAGCSRRWKEYIVGNGSVRSLGFLLSRLHRLHLPRLRAASIRWGYGALQNGIVEMKEPLPLLTGVFNRALQELDIVSIRIVSFYVPEIHEPFTLRALTVLKLTTVREATDDDVSLVDWGTLRRMLTSAPRLSHLVLIGPVIDFEMEGNGAVESCDLRALRKLEVVAPIAYPRYRWHLFNAIQAKWLETLLIVGQDDISSEAPGTDLSTPFFLDNHKTKPKFPRVKELSLDGATDPQLLQPTSMILAFPKATSVTLSGKDTAAFSTSLHQWARNGVRKWCSVTHLTLLNISTGGWCRMADELWRWLNNTSWYRAAGNRRPLIRLGGPLLIPQECQRDFYWHVSMLQSVATLSFSVRFVPRQPQPELQAQRVRVA